MALENEDSCIVWSLDSPPKMITAPAFLIEMHASICFTYLCVCVGVVFDNLDGTNLQYTIRPVHEVDGERDRSTWNTDIAQPQLQEVGPRFSPK